ncbi:MAG: hypothetical protein ACOCXM_01360 [Myxococcota bacterium]
MSAAGAADWVEAARDASRRGTDRSDLEVLHGRLPPLADADGLRAVLTIALAAAAWGWVLAGPEVAAHPLSPVLLLAHLVVLTLTLRALFAARRVGNRLAMILQARRHRLVLAPEGLLLDHPRGEVAVARDEVVDIRERGDWRQRKGGRRFAEVFVVLTPDAEGHPRWLALPPVFERTPGVLAEHLMRWRGPAPTPDEAAHPEPARLASRVYEDAAHGRPPPGGVVLRHGHGWIRRGPYATLLLGAVLVERAVRVPPRAWAYVDPSYLAGIALCLGAVPLVWMYLQRRHVAPRRGLALVLTPAEILIRIRSGILRASWPRVARVYVEAKRAWSVLEGHHAARVLVLERQDAPSIRYEEAFLGLPAEVGQGLCEAYRRGELPK